MANYLSSTQHSKPRHKPKRRIFQPKSRASRSQRSRGRSHHWLAFLEEVGHEHPGLRGRPLGPEELGREVPEHRHPHDAGDALSQAAAAAALPRRGAAPLRLRRPCRGNRRLRHRRRRAGSERGGRGGRADEMRRETKFLVLWFSVCARCSGDLTGAFSL